MPAPCNYLACDLGAESGRVMLGTLAGRRLQLEELHRFSNGPIRLLGTLRWDVVRIFEEIKMGLRVAAKHVPASISVDSWGVDYLLMRGREPMLRLPYHYRDRRTERPYIEARARLGEATIFGHTGVQFMPINSLYQLLADLAEDAVLLCSADRFLMIADWLHYLLSGRAVGEETNASTTQLYDPRRRAWSDELIALCGLPRAIFPEITAPGTRLGPLLPEIVEETGLPALEVIAGCTHDTAAAVAAVPARGDDWAYLSSGTWSLIGVELAAPLINDAAREANFTNEVGYNGAIRFLKNIIGLWLLQECRRTWAHEEQDYDYSTLTRLAEGVPMFRSLINPNNPRFLLPGNMPAEIRAACAETGQPVPQTPGEHVRCILESLALLYREKLDELERITGRTIRVLHIVGGGSKNALLNQFAANATGRTVLAGPIEATALGNVVVQALAHGHLGSLAEARQIIGESFLIETFAPAEDSEWAVARARFAGLTLPGIRL